MSPSPTKDTVNSYLKCREKAARLQSLASMRQNNIFLPISLAEDLLCLDLDDDEKEAIINTVGSRDGRALEHFLTQNLASWPQELAALAVRRWSGGTDNLLWFRMLVALKSAILPQRVLFTIVDHAHTTGGVHVVTAAANAEGLEVMSPTFRALILYRAVVWGVDLPRLRALAHAALRDLSARRMYEDHRAVPSAIAYLARFHGDDLQEVARKAENLEIWLDWLRVGLIQLDAGDKQVERVAKLLAKPPKRQADERLAADWPPTWQRHLLPADVVAAAIPLLASRDEALSHDSAVHTAGSNLRQSLSGVPATTLIAALAKIADDKLYGQTIAYLGSMVGVPASPVFIEQLRTRLQACTNPAELLSLLPLRLRLELTDADAKITGHPSPFTLLKQEEANVLRGDTSVPQVVFSDYMRTDAQGRLVYLSDAEDESELRARKAFFNLAYRGGPTGGLGQNPANTASNHYFGRLIDAWQTPAAAKLPALAQAARQVDGIMRLCYLNTLGRFQGHDEAALKILDFIRAKDEDELRAVIDALGGLQTARAAQELVAALTRPNMTPALCLKACAILQGQDLSNLQNELRSALYDLAGDRPSAGDTRGDHADPDRLNIREAITALISPLPSGKPTASSPDRNNALSTSTTMSGVSDHQLDQALIGKIAHYRDLSSEVKRALRTSQFFHIQVTHTSAPETIDLSPLIDMQYKALELLFREQFEDVCSRLIHRGTLQRRLDIIGYARPIPHAMDDFENYVASLPIVREIPFFSKFKLRKLLRAICQFRPGRRFTLDGLKAFGLFFLCFSRKECRYGLAEHFPLGFASDRELFEFCKMLHMQQDARNRAAHEGFHPDAASDIDGIWRNTAEIIQTAMKIGQALGGPTPVAADPFSSTPTQGEKKVS